MIRELWNLGLKVTDVDRELDFFQKVGAEVISREQISLLGEKRDCATVLIGRVRVSLFDTVAFEHRVAGGVRPGLTHAVYEVDRFEDDFARICSLGAEVLLEPTDVDTLFDRRRIAFFRSPGGFIFEIMQVVETKGE